MGDVDGSPPAGRPEGASDCRLSKQLHDAFDRHVRQVVQAREHKVSQLTLRSEVEATSADLSWLRANKDTGRGRPWKRGRAAARGDGEPEGGRRRVAEGGGGGDAEGDGGDGDSRLVAEAAKYESVAVAGLGERLPTDTYDGDVNFRTLRMLLETVDARGFERSAQQLQFHAAFEVATARVVYKKDWALHKPAIMESHGWNEMYSEVCISTPRRFGKTFRRAARAWPPLPWQPQHAPSVLRSIAIYCACMALSFGVEIVIFSPARRASRKILERMAEFVRLLGAENRVTEYNQENLRLRSYDGKSSLIRSFPSAVASMRNGAETAFVKNNINRYGQTVEGTVEVEHDAERDMYYVHATDPLFPWPSERDKRRFYFENVIRGIGHTEKPYCLTARWMSHTYSMLHKKDNTCRMLEPGKSKLAFEVGESVTFVPLPVGHFEAVDDSGVHAFTTPWNPRTLSRQDAAADVQRQDL